MVDEEGTQRLLESEEEVLTEALQQARVDRDTWRLRALDAQLRVRVVGTALALMLVVTLAQTVAVFLLWDQVHEQGSLLDRQQELGDFQAAREDRSDCRARIQSAATVADQLSDAAFKAAFDPRLPDTELPDVITAALAANDRAIMAANRLAAVDDPSLIGSGEPGTPEEQECPAPERPNFLSDTTMSTP